MPAPLILLTRPRLASEAVAHRLVNYGVAADRVLIAPLMETVTTGAKWSPEGYRGFVFTSAEGVRHATAFQEFRGHPAFCVGDRTARAAAAAGMDAVSAGGTVEDLIALIAARCPAQPLLHLRGEDSQGDAARRLSMAGTPTHEVAIYRQQAHPLADAARTLLADGSAIVAPAYSALSAARLSAELDAIAARLHLVAISPAVAEAWPGPAPVRLTIADRPDGAAMDRAILHALRVETEQASS
jgi:uroporphyrinogen-III synthase